MKKLKMHSYYLLVLLFAICMNLNAYGEDKFFYIPETKLYSLKELALNGDKMPPTSLQDIMIFILRIQIAYIEPLSGIIYPDFSDKKMDTGKPLTL